MRKTKAASAVVSALLLLMACMPTSPRERIAADLCSTTANQSLAAVHVNGRPLPSAFCANGKPISETEFNQLAGEAQQRAAEEERNRQALVQRQAKVKTQCGTGDRIVDTFWPRGTYFSGGQTVDTMHGRPRACYEMKFALKNCILDVYGSMTQGAGVPHTNDRSLLLAGIRQRCRSRVAPFAHYQSVAGLAPVAPIFRDENEAMAYLDAATDAILWPSVPY